MRIAALIAAVAVTATFALPAWSASTPPQLTSFSVESVHMSSNGLKLTIAGTVDCSVNAHYKVWLWVYESSRGALAHALLPVTRKHSRKKPHLACSGASQSWTMHALALGKHPTGFATGPAQACAVVTVSHSRQYVFQSNCTNVTVG